jgi:hypothetical protein
MEAFGPSAPGRGSAKATASPHSVQPTNFELVVSQKAATVMGITMPQTLLLRAD